MAVTRPQIPYRAPAAIAEHSLAHAERERRLLVRVNDEFVRYLRTVMARTGPVEKAQLRLDRPADAIFAELEIGTAIECGVSIQVDNHERRTQARIVIPPPAPAGVLVGFILS